MRREPAAPERLVRRLIFPLVAAAILAGAAPRLLAPRAAASQPLRIAAAADLQQALPEIARGWERETGQKAVLSFGATGTLARQIENGAPFDLFAAANTAYVDRLARQGLVAATGRRVYALGHLALVTRGTAGRPALAELLEPRVRKVAIANPEHAPYGQAAREALRNAGAWERLQPKLVLGENVRQALQYVQTGNADAGIVALSVAGAPGLTAARLDPRLHAPIRQAAAVIRGRPRESAARSFLAYLTGPAGRSVLRRHGFGLPEEAFGR